MRAARAVAPAALLLGLALLAACVRQPRAAAPGAGYAPEQWARDALAASRGFLEAARQNHAAECAAVPPCSIPGVRDKGKCERICAAIRRASHAHNAALDALSLYCAGPGWSEGGACNPQPAWEPRLRAAIAELERILADLKGALQ